MQTSRKCLSKVGIWLQRLHKDIGDTIQIKKLSDSMEIIPLFIIKDYVLHQIHVINLAKKYMYGN